MDDTTTQILSIAGAVFGCVGMVTGIASAIYTRRQAIAAEGPSYPGIEVSNHGWDWESPDWYSIDFVIRNRTSNAWEIVCAKAGRFRSEPIFSRQSRPFTGEDYDPKYTPFDAIPERKLPRCIALGSAVGPSGTQHFHGHGGDVVHLSLFLRPSAFSRITNRLCVSLSLEAKSERVRHKDIAVIRRLKPRTINPA